ncbi:phosphoglycerate kinase family protein [Neorickettsia helminthoeca str. Oregon]|uniref:Phosphoglycerate kinase n=1 Tax=Neorickettsia helminthoeca str. Oregon TaxID=1286528 RepID=X5GWB3_9RICK|nr:phosphoglycerate kinase [Neorickettsia helminthoeca]AHX11357.1 phosphoglycerate kinase family protein [Neorickettsia helminthoeca str. Oregon]
MIGIDKVRSCRVILRVDFNVPVTADGVINDFSRIAVALPTIELLLKNNCSVLLLSHFGKPDSGSKSTFSFNRIIEQIREFSRLDIRLIQSEYLDNASTLKLREVALLENIRFFDGEVSNDPEFARRLAQYGDVYINDAFSVSHREHASVVGIPNYLPSTTGLAFAQEYSALDSIASKDSAAIIGGSKISTKLPLIKGLLKKVGTVILGGALVNVVLKSRGYEIGRSLCEGVHCDISLENLFIPFDFITSSGVEDENYHIVDARFVPKHEMMLDVGPASLIAIKTILGRYKKILWNGPIGAFEVKPFDSGTIELGNYISFLTRNSGVMSVIGGGDTLAAIKLIQDPCFSYISTSGGAFLKFQEEGTLPGIEAIKSRQF